MELSSEKHSRKIFKELLQLNKLGKCSVFIPVLESHYVPRHNITLQKSYRKNKF